MKRALGVAVLLASATAARADEPTPADTTYVVEPGDTCLGIAVRVLGDREQLDALHRANPQLGALPHDLVAGSILNLPPRTTMPDAQVTRARGDVKLRKASSSAWDVAVRGAFMFRAWRAWSGEQSNAELAFRGDSKLGMRERTFGWTADDSLQIKICAVETPYHLTLKLKFTGDDLTLDSETNVGFGATKRPTLNGKAQ